VALLKQEGSPQPPCLGKKQNLVFGLPLIAVTKINKTEKREPV